ncbi:MAG: hypothetical protein ACK5KU_07125 [Beutenbergiaceae bacterium]
MAQRLEQVATDLMGVVPEYWTGVAASGYAALARWHATEMRTIAAVAREASYAARFHESELAMAGIG